MDDTAVQLTIAAVGIAGTLAAALLTQFLSSRAEESRKKSEDRSRWLSDRLRINTRFLAECLRLERNLWSAAAMLDRDDRSERLPGFKSILLTPDEGIAGVVDETTRAILVEEIESAFKRLDELEAVVAEIALVGEPGEIDAARELHEALWEVAGMLEGFAPFDAAADAVEICRSARNDFTNAARSSLRTDGSARSIDSRTRARQLTETATDR